MQELLILKSSAFCVFVHATKKTFPLINQTFSTTATDLPVDNFLTKHFRKKLCIFVL